MISGFGVSQLLLSSDKDNSGMSLVSPTLCTVSLQVKAMLSLGCVLSWDKIVPVISSSCAGLSSRFIQVGCFLTKYLFLSSLMSCLEWHGFV